MGHIVRRSTPEGATQREPLPTTKISELRLDELVRETRAEEDLADGTPIEMSTIAMPRLQRPAGGQPMPRLRTTDETAPTRQMPVPPSDASDASDASDDEAAPSEREAAAEAAPSVELSATQAPAAVYPAAPRDGAGLPRVLLALLVLTLGWLGASLIHALR